MNKPLPAGYRKRPWELTVLAVFFVLVPVLSTLSRVVAAVGSGHPFSLFGTVVNGPWGLAHGVLVAVLWVLFLAVAWGIFRVVKWGFVLCMVAAVANSLFSTILYSVSRTPTGLVESVSFNPFQLDVLLNLVFFVPVILLLREKILAPFFNPRMKWWEQHPRVKASLRIEATLGDTKRSYHSFDLSESGMFLGTTEFPDLPVGGTFPAEIHLDEVSTVVKVRCQAVWISDGKGRMPMGVGVTFQYAERGQRRLLGNYIKEQIRQGQLLERT